MRYCVSDPDNVDPGKYNLQETTTLYKKRPVSGHRGLPQRRSSGSRFQGVHQQPRFLSLPGKVSQEVMRLSFSLLKPACIFNALTVTKPVGSRVYPTGLVTGIGAVNRPLPGYAGVNLCRTPDVVPCADHRRSKAKCRCPVSVIWPTRTDGDGSRRGQADRSRKARETRVPGRCSVPSACRRSAM
jgi:hypothetical protein